VEKAVSSRNYRIGCDAVRFLMASQVRGHHQALSAAISPQRPPASGPHFQTAGRCRLRNGSARMSTDDPKLPVMTDRFRAMQCRSWRTCWSTPSAIRLRNATPSIFHQHHIGRVLRSSCSVPGRRIASSRCREPRPGRALLFGRVTYEMMEAAFRPPARKVARPDRMEPFARTIDAAKKYVVSGTMDRVDWNAELVRGDLGKAVQH
jgi:hypothetical protein